MKNRRSGIMRCVGFWAAAVLGVGVAGCGGASTQQPAASAVGGGAAAKVQLAQGASLGAAGAAHHAGGGTTMVRLPADWKSPFLPSAAAQESEQDLDLALYDTLVTLNQNYQVIPYLAQSWSVTPSTVVFHLKRDVTCSDGTRVTPSVVKTSLDYAIDPKNASTLPQRLGPGKITVEANSNAWTVTVTSSKPFNELLYAFVDVTSGIACPAAFAKGAAPMTHSYGSGPYVLESAVHGQGVTMKRRDDWTWGPMGATAKTLPSTLDFKIVSDEATAANMLEAGELNIGHILGVATRQLAARASLLRFVGNDTTPHYIAFNLAREPLKSNQKLRQALLTAFDRQDFFNAELGSGNGTVTNSIFGPNMDCYANLANLIPKADPQKAKALLGEAGYKQENGAWMKNGKPLTIDLLGASTQQSAPEYLADALRNIGVKVKLTTLPLTQWVPELFQGDFDMTAIDLTRASPNPSAMSRYLVGPPPGQGGANYSQVDDPALDALVAEAQSAPLNRRCELWRQFQTSYLKQFDGLPLGIEASQWFTTKYDILPLGTSLSTWSIGRRAK